MPMLLLLLAYLAGLSVGGLMSRPRKADVAVVLGSAVEADRQPSSRLRARLDTALRLYQAGIVSRILVSGGVEDPDGARDEAEVMAV